MSNNGRPDTPPNIYKNGRLKTIDEMIEEGIAKPISNDVLEKIKELTDDAEVDLNKPLTKDECMCEETIKSVLTPLSCPFCGKADGYAERIEICVYQYICDCGARGMPVEKLEYECHEGTPENDAIKAWNTRTLDQ